MCSPTAIEPFRSARRSHGMGNSEWDRWLRVLVIVAICAAVGFYAAQYFGP